MVSCSIAAFATFASWYCHTRQHHKDTDRQTIRQTHIERHTHNHTHTQTDTNTHEQRLDLCFLVSGGPACFNFLALPCQLVGEPLAAVATLCLLPDRLPLMRGSGDLEDDQERELEGEKDRERDLERESEE